jgi:hypothetical protein
MWIQFMGSGIVYRWCCHPKIGPLSEINAVILFKIDNRKPLHVKFSNAGRYECTYKLCIEHIGVL